MTTPAGLQSPVGSASVAFGCDFGAFVPLSVAVDDVVDDVVDDMVDDVLDDDTLPGCAPG
jgi:hypothetical protein